MSGGGEGLVAERAQGVGGAADHLAGHRQGGPVAAEPVGDPPVVGVIGRAGAGGALGGLEQRPAQQRRALPGQVRGGAFPSEECTVMSNPVCRTALREAEKRRESPSSVHSAAAVIGPMP